MRRFVQTVLASVFACVCASCAAIAGVSDYTSGDCTSGCDAGLDRTVPPPSEAGRDAPEDTTLADSVTPPGPDSAGDVSADVSSDVGVTAEAGACEGGLLACDGGCADPASPSSCGACGNTCPTACALVDGAYSCVSSCPSSAPNLCSGACVDTDTSAANCGSCGQACAAGETCVSGGCVSAETDAGDAGDASDGATADAPVDAPAETGPDASEAGPDASDAGDAGTCGAAGCPVSAATYGCRVGGCNAAGGACNGSGLACSCTKDSQCKSGHCVIVAGQNDSSCTSATCTGTGAADGFGCMIASPGIPAVTPPPPPTCPAGSGYHSTTLGCDATHTNCYCTADNQCPSGKCVPNANNNNNCAGSTCTGTGTPDYRGCQPVAAIPSCPIYVGCPSSTTCSYPQCYCTNDAVCDTGKCIPSSSNGHCSSCTGSGSTDDGHGCEPAPTSIPCTAPPATCTTSLTPAPVLNPAKTACVCVSDADCSSGKCVNADNVCTNGTTSSNCSGTGTPDATNCATVTSTATAYSCPIGACNDVASPTSSCTAAGVPCWCTSDSQCGTSKCAAWAGCATGACTGSGVLDSFHCAP